MATSTGEASSPNRPGRPDPAARPVLPSARPVLPAAPRSMPSARPVLPAAPRSMPTAQPLLPSVQPLPAAQPVRKPAAIRRRTLLGEGATDERIRSLRRTGQLSTLRPGLYLPASAAGGLYPVDRHRVLAAAASEDLPGGSVISHVSAVAVLGLPLWDVRLDRVHVTREITSGAHRSAGLHVHAAGREFSAVTAGDLVVTAPARTVVDSARMLSFKQGVVIADAALHANLVTSEELAREVELARGRKGASRARAVVAFADGRSESVGESRSRVLLARGGLAPPELQYPVAARDGREVARCDFGYPDLMVVGEFDGEVKYGRLLRPGQQAGDVVFEEKRREDAIRDLGWIVVRWVWAELRSPALVLERIRRAIARGHQWTPAGR